MNRMIDDDGLLHTAKIIRLCEWQVDDLGNFDTSCRNCFTFIVDGIEENKFKFCPYCGGKIEEIYSVWRNEDGN